MPRLSAAAAHACWDWPDGEPKAQPAVDAERAVSVLRISPGPVVAEVEVVLHPAPYVEGGNVDVLISDCGAVVPGLAGRDSEGPFDALERVEGPPEVEVGRPIAIVRLVPKPNGVAVGHPGAFDGPLVKRRGEGNLLWNSTFPWIALNARSRGSSENRTNQSLVVYTPHFTAGGLKITSLVGTFDGSKSVARPTNARPTHWSRLFRAS
jgi:hypothetical protein